MGNYVSLVPWLISVLALGWSFNSTAGGGGLKSFKYEQHYCPYLKWQGLPSSASKREWMHRTDAQHLATH